MLVLSMDRECMFMEELMPKVMIVTMTSISFLFVILLLLLLITLIDPLEWTKCISKGPAKCHHSAVCRENFVYIFGGKGISLNLHCLRVLQDMTRMMKQYSMICGY